MFFNAKENIFSLAKTSTTPPGRDIKMLWEELYCFLLLAGLISEGEGTEGAIFTPVPIQHEHFSVSCGNYNGTLGRMVETGLKSRFMSLLTHPNITPHEANMLGMIDKLFLNERAWYTGLTGSNLYGIALGRGFSPALTSVARYVAMTFGQGTYPEPTEVPSLYISTLGNIHLSTETTVLLSVPELPYGSKLNGNQSVTALWAMISALVEGTVSESFPGDRLGDILANLTFMTQPCEFEKSIPVPVYAASLYMKRVIGLDECNPVAVAASFYQSFLYGGSETKIISRVAILHHLLDVMVRKMGTSRFDLYAPNSYYNKLAESISTGRLGGKVLPKRPFALRLALEALDNEVVKDPTDDESTDDSAADPLSDEDLDESPDSDTAEDDTEFDPTSPTPVKLDEGSGTSMDTIGLISFNKTGEGVDENLYREAVVALNDRIKDDDTLAISTEVKEALNYWVNGFLYLTAIASTKDYMANLGLQKFLKKF